MKVILNRAINIVNVMLFFLNMCITPAMPMIASAESVKEADMVCSEDNKDVYMISYVDEDTEKSSEEDSEQYIVCAETEKQLSEIKKEYKEDIVTTADIAEEYRNQENSA